MILSNKFHKIMKRVNMSIEFIIPRLKYKLIQSISLTTHVDIQFHYNMVSVVERRAVHIYGCVRVRTFCAYTRVYSVTV